MKYIVEITIYKWDKDEEPEDSATYVYEDHDRAREFFDSIIELARSS